MTTRAGASLPSIASGNMQVDFSWAKFIKDLEQTVCKSRQTEWQDVYSPLLTPLGKFIEDLEQTVCKCRQTQWQDVYTSLLTPLGNFIKDLEQAVCKSRQTEWQDVYSPLVNPLGKFIKDLDRQFVNAEIGKLSEKRNSREDRHVSSIAAVFDDLKDYLSDSDLSLGPKL